MISQQVKGQTHDNGGLKCLPFSFGGRVLGVLRDTKWCLVGVVLTAEPEGTKNCA